MATTSGTTLTYDEYVTLLLSTASAYDDQFKPKRSKRHVLLHDIQDYYDDNDDEVFFDPDTGFDIDCPLSSIQAYATNFRPKHTPKPNNSKVGMPSEKWFGLDDASKAIWDRLDDKAKSIILGYTKPESQSNRPTGNSSTGRLPKSTSMRCQPMIFSLQTFTMLHRLEMISIPTSRKKTMNPHPLRTFMICVQTDKAKIHIENDN
jgi:hypothetical protein